MKAELSPAREAAARDPLVEWASGRWSGPLVRRLGLPSPRRLKRAQGAYRAAELEGRSVAVGAASGGYASDAAREALERLGATVRDGPLWSVRSRIEVALFDATGCRDVASLGRLRMFFGPLMRQLAPCARLVALARDPGECASPLERAAAHAAEGFVRSLAKEVGRSGSTANLLYVSRAALDRLEGPLRFFCSHRSTYVSGRAVLVTAKARQPSGLAGGTPRLQGKFAVVTGAARGLGAATAVRLAEEGARVLCVDVPATAEPLESLARRIGGLALATDITAADAPRRLTDCIGESAAGGTDILVHNAGITRDRTLLKMSEAEWDAVMAVNLKAIVDIDAAVDDAGLLRDDAREICLSSISGIAGNVGQANYAASKAALIGYASARAERLAARGITVNCAAPGFIETEMTKRVPFLIREAGRRMNALSQGGQPRDVAELVTFLALPESSGITGQTIRVCGQALLGA